MGEAVSARTAATARVTPGLTDLTHGVRTLGKGILYFCLIAFGLTFILPYFWMVSTSLKQTGYEFQYPPVWIPNPVVWRNYVDTWNLLPFALWFWNTIVIVVLSMAGAILTASMAGFGFARLRFPGRGLLFTLCLSTMMLPSIVTLIPKFILFTALGWVNTNLPLWVPSWFGGDAFFIFLCRQFFLGIPRELDEAARIDGASSWRIYAQIVLPLSRPVLATMAVFAFQGSWNDFLGPLIYLPDREKMTLAVGLNTMLGMYQTNWNYLMAASTLMTLPIVVLFFLAQRHFVRGIATTGLAGR
ncbi:MAG TPA: carbohydrate ABC transporter permease [Chloroflexota bacterium]|nr:carbohydrate ABC transporter permease [Chloroflexota bacterium]